MAASIRDSLSAQIQRNQVLLSLFVVVVVVVVVVVAVVGGCCGGSSLLLLLFKQFSQLFVKPAVGLNSHKIGLNLILRIVQFVHTYKTISVAHGGERKRRNVSTRNSSHPMYLVSTLW